MTGERQRKQKKHDGCSWANMTTVKWWKQTEQEAWDEDNMEKY